MDGNKRNHIGKARLREELDYIFLSQPEIAEHPQPPESKNQMQLWLGLQARGLLREV
jgi:hypothetical protein